MPEFIFVQKSFLLISQIISKFAKNNYKNEIFTPA